MRHFTELWPHLISISYSDATPIAALFLVYLLQIGWGLSMLSIVCYSSAYPVNTILWSLCKMCYIFPIWMCRGICFLHQQNVQHIYAVVRTKITERCLTSLSIVRDIDMFLVLRVYVWYWHVRYTAGVRVILTCSLYCACTCDIDKFLRLRMYVWYWHVP